ncbi:disulfide bond formation protein B [Salinicola endophyticus]|uniref:Disulfide bond formation protein B n=1 Tax=Salinicola endophyticus TaxID=1949083 RepID=A0ABY8FI69_9GAMM|nr:disulfide bond formation protein B [Salinicola endophyticus]WFF40226.1 disulfide bond formation protein B [Salinicola endophyticus]
MQIKQWAAQASVRQWCGLGLAMCCLMMAVALYLQYGVGLEPCPLCIFQRVAVIIAGCVFLVGLLHNPRRRGGLVYGVLALLAAAGGIIVAGRHVWLQTLPPDSVPSCGPGLDYMLGALPLWDVMSRVLSGSGECALVEGSLWGVTLPQWTLLGFAIMALIPLALIVTRLRGSAAAQPAAAA